LAPANIENFDEKAEKSRLDCEFPAGGGCGSRERDGSGMARNLKEHISAAQGLFGGRTDISSRVFQILYQEPLAIQ
jgi:hypothetical protein